MIDVEGLVERVERIESRLGMPIRGKVGRMMDLEEAKQALSVGGGGSFEGVGELPLPTPDQAYKDHSTLIVCPTRGRIDSRVIESWNGLIHAMNQRRLGPVFARGYEVGKAYDTLISNVVKDVLLKDWKYILTVEDDNLPPPDGHLRLLEAMDAHPEFDAIAGLYHMKDAAQLPMAYGDPEDYKRTGHIKHFPVDRSSLDPNGGPVEVLGIPMGFTLWRMDLFRKVPPSWFVTLNEGSIVDGKIVPLKDLTFDQRDKAKRCMTQDLSFCEVAVTMHQRRFAVHPGVRVGHLDTASGFVY